MSQGFEDFYKREFPAVYRACVAFLGPDDTAFDAAQEAFSRAFARWRRLRDSPWAGGWVMTTALNLCRRARARRRLQSTRSAEHFPSIADAPNEDRVYALGLLRTLPLRRRTVALLYYFGDLPVSAIAELMGLSEGGVKAHLFHARRTLRQELNEPRHKENDEHSRRNAINEARGNR